MGSIPLFEVMSAPIALKGFKTLFMGRCDKERSPLNIVFIPKPAIIPSINLSPVPELPRSKGSMGSTKPVRLFLT